MTSKQEYGLFLSLNHDAIVTCMQLNKHYKTPLLNRDFREKDNGQDVES